MMGDLQPWVLLRGLGLLVPCGTVGRGLTAVSFLIQCLGSWAYMGT